MKHYNEIIIASICGTLLVAVGTYCFTYYQVKNSIQTAQKIEIKSVVESPINSHASNPELASVTDTPAR